MKNTYIIETRSNVLPLNGFVFNITKQIRVSLVVDNVSLVANKVIHSEASQ